MNRNAQRHLDRAKTYLDKGDGFYEKAADEIIAARGETPLTWKEVAAAVGKSAKWCQQVVAWRESGSTNLPKPEWQRGSHATTAEIKQGAKKLLRDAPMEQVERIIEDLPQERQQAIAAAAGHDYSKYRERLEEEARNRTPAQQKEIEAAEGAVDRFAGRALSGFTSLSIAQHLQEATKKLREMIERDALSGEVMAPIDKAYDELATEIEVARAMTGLETGR
jgi:hypothetical protein